MTPEQREQTHAHYSALAIELHNRYLQAARPSEFGAVKREAERAICFCNHLDINALLHQITDQCNEQLKIGQ